MQTIRFRRPTNQSKESPAEPPKRVDRHAGMLQDQLQSTLVSELLAGGANFAPCEVLCCDVLQHPRLRRMYDPCMDDSVEIPSMSEGMSAEISLDLPSSTPESTFRVLQVLTTSLKRPDPRRGRSPRPSRQYEWIHLVKQGGATSEALLHPDFPSDDGLHLFLDDLIPGSSSSLVSHDSAASEDAIDDLPPPCLLNACEVKGEPKVA
ncbi:hypothetical protein BJ322DRAFT_1214802 [Thelephora terrestris]|uniref:Uncharacterized protein n=1 Tax=Thelephora terrestris TaxID=56493 RepID=A0A9P6H2J3_9AGAM|nr:hypothetical protein BJ322DRAFT_1214802 [Thelephora terrestris]